MSGQEQAPQDQKEPVTGDTQLPDAAETADDPLQVALAERDANWEKYLRAEAELINFRRRVNQEREEERKYAGMHLIRALLPTMDNLQRAVEAGRKEQSDSQGGLLQGVEMVLKQMLDTLEQHGVKAIPAVGEEFDPNRHEALQQIPTAEHPPMTVLQEVERGFMLNDRVVRPSKVLVASSPNS